MSLQLHFPDEVTDVVYSGEPYSLRRPGTRDGNDGVLRGYLGVLMEGCGGWG